MDVNTVMTAIAILAAAFLYWRKGGNQASAEVIATYKVQVDQLKEAVHDLKERADRQSDEIGQLKGRLAEKNDRIKDLEAILQGRNPEMVQFMQYLTKVAKQSEEHMKNYGTLPAVLLEVRDFMHNMNEHFAQHTDGRTGAVVPGAGKV